MPDDAFRAFIRVFLGLGLLMVLCSVPIILTSPGNSPEFILSVCNVGIGLALLSAAGLVVIKFRDQNDG
jgi:hypothetical protein